MVIIVVSAPPGCCANFGGNSVSIVNIFVFTTVLTRITNDDDSRAAMPAHRMLVKQGLSGASGLAAGRTGNLHAATHRDKPAALRPGYRCAPSRPSFVLRAENPGGFHPSASNGMMTPDDITMPDTNAPAASRWQRSRATRFHGRSHRQGPRDSQAELPWYASGARAARGDVR
jgi:hypothetical protein